jgi:hypothetical protein
MVLFDPLLDHHNIFTLNSMVADPDPNVSLFKKPVLDPEQSEKLDPNPH